MSLFLRCVVFTSFASAGLAWPSAARAQPDKPVVVVDVAPDEPELDAAAVREAVGVELGDAPVAPDDARASQAVGTVRIAIDRATHELLVSFSGHPTSIARRVALPGDKASTQKAAALLAGNLARNEGEDLAESLRKPKPAPAAPPDAEANRELEELGNALLTLDLDNHRRDLTNRTLVTMGNAAMIVGTSVMFSAGAWRDVTLPIGIAGGAYAVADVLFLSSYLSFAGGVDNAARIYLEGHGRQPPDQLRATVLEAWRGAAVAEHQRRHSMGVLGVALGGFELTAATAAFIYTSTQLPLGRAAIWAPIMVGGAVGLGVGIAVLSSSGPTETALAHYEHAQAVNADMARLTLRPIVAPLQGGGMAGFGGTF
ncbi:MAG TPA: hypothetical protein VGI39_18330 [Polyangiaceae bacterium]|jgi:hypothetical protein